MIVSDNYNKEIRIIQTLRFIVLLISQNVADQLKWSTN